MIIKLSFETISHKASHLEVILDCAFGGLQDSVC